MMHKINRKRWAVSGFVILALVSIFIGGCFRHDDNVSMAQISTLDKVRKTGELHVGYFLFEPTIMQDKNGKLNGVFIDLIESIGKALDAKVIYHNVDLANFVAGLQSQQYDVSIGATFATPQRATAVAFTSPIFYCGYTGVVKPEEVGKYNTWQDMDKKGTRVAVKQGSAIDDFVRENFRNATIVRLQGADLTLPLAAVSSGQADVGLMNQLTVFTYLRAHPELKEVLAKRPIVPTNFSWAVRQGDQRWLNYLNTCIQYYINTGDIYKWESKYGIPLMHKNEELVFPKMSYPQYWVPEKQ